MSQTERIPDCQATARTASALAGSWLAWMPDVAWRRAASVAGLGGWLVALCSVSDAGLIRFASAIAGIAMAGLVVGALVVTARTGGGVARKMMTRGNQQTPSPSRTDRDDAAMLPVALAAGMADLTSQRDRAQAANVAKSRFLASMSHEVRTPMTGIVGMTDLLKGTDTTPEQRTYINAIDSAARTLLGLIDEILDLSKIEAGRLTLVAQPFAVESLVLDAVELLARRAHEKKLELAWEIAADVPDVLSGDAARLRQMILNLLGNAIKFTEAGGVLVAVSVAKAHLTSPGQTIALEIAIRDTGAGLTGTEIARLFQEFAQGANPAGHRSGGSGLGLAITRLLATAMGGTIAVESVPGAGSTFTIAVPLTVIDQCHGANIPIRPPGPAREVVIVSDRSIESEAMGRALKRHGHAVVVVGSPGALTTVAARAHAIDQLIVDGSVPIETAGALLAAARAVGRAPGIAATVTIAADERPALPRYRAIGFDQFMVRPVRPRSLLRWIAGAADAACDERAAYDTARIVTDRTVASKRGRRMRVLLAEDNDINALLALSVLEKAGCDVCHARNGREAVEAVRSMLDGEASFDIVLMDIVMPDLDGVGAAREIRALCALAQRHAPPIVALTANAFPEDRAQYLADGLDDYLAKPFEAAAIRRLLARWTDVAAA